MVSEKRTACFLAPYMTASAPQRAPVYVRGERYAVGFSLTLLTRLTAEGRT